MTYKVCYWDDIEKVQKERDSMPEEDAQRELDIQAVQDAFPKRVTALQGMLALHQAGLNDAYDKWANDPSRTFVERAYIQKSLVWNWDDQVMIDGCKALGVTDDQKKQLFILAASL